MELRRRKRGQFTIGAPTTVKHTFNATGVDDVTLTEVDDHGNVATTSNQVTVDLQPSAAFTASPQQALAGQAISFDGTGSSDPNAGGSISSWAWSFGDGSNATGSTAIHAYSGAGVYTVSLVVTDALGLQSTAATKTVTIEGPPSASFTASPQQAPVGQAISFDGTGSSDPNAGGSVSSWAWSFGDGATGTGPKLAHAYGAPGVYTVSLAVTDALGLQSTAATKTVTIGSPPTAAFNPSSKQAFVGQAVSFDGTGSCLIPTPAVRFRRGRGASATAPPAPGQSRRTRTAHRASTPSASS